MSELVSHTIPPVYNEQARVLILGTMPSPASRAAAFYYGHPRNRFWRVMERLWGLPDHALTENDQRVAFLLENRIALWDVLARCEIHGASDASIRNAEPNNLALITEHASIQAVFTTGAKAAQLYHRLCEKHVGMPAVALPSTSPANARMSLEQLVEAYRIVKETAEVPARA